MLRIPRPPKCLHKWTVCVRNALFQTFKCNAALLYSKPFDGFRIESGGFGDGRSVKPHLLEVSRYGQPALGNAFCPSFLDAFLDAFFNAFAHSAVIEGLLHADRVPEPFVGRQLSVAECGFFERVHCLLQFGVFQQLLPDLARPLVYLGENAEPQHLHPLLAVGVWVELREFDEHQVQPVYHLLRMLDVHEAVVVVEFPELGLEYFVHEVQGVYGLEEGIVVPLFDLPHVRFRRVEQDALAELLRPYHLHLHDEVPSPVVPAPDVHDAVLPGGLSGTISAGRYSSSVISSPPRRQEQCVQEAHHQVGMFSEHFLECRVGFLGSGTSWASGFAVLLRMFSWL